jgi:hypothetical protein
MIDLSKFVEMNKYKELEKQVAEMQKEIDRLKAQEQKPVNTFKDDIWKVLDDFKKKSHYSNDVNCIDDFTDVICNVLSNYLPKYIENPEDNYDAGYNNAIYKMNQNLGLNK